MCPYSRLGTATRDANGRPENDGHAGRTAADRDDFSAEPREARYGRGDMPLRDSSRVPQEDMLSPGRRGRCYSGR